LFSFRVETCAPTDPIGAAAKKMHNGSFLQLPVYDGDRLIGLLTAESIARWLASRLAGGEELLEEEAVEAVMKHQEESHAHVLMIRSATVEVAHSAFEDHLHRGLALDAIILTHSGKKAERPLGIVTVSDMPRLLGAARV
jgi:CBS domain-containing protein